MNHGDEWIGVGESIAVGGICFMLYGLTGLKNSGVNVDSDDYVETQFKVAQEFDTNTGQ